MVHSFLFAEGIWRADGEYVDAGGSRFAATGETTIRHEPGRWRFEAVLRLRGDPARVTHNRYDIEPFAPGARSTHWTSINPAIGTLRGRFVLAGDAILSFYESPTARYRGFECIQQVEGTRYAARGTLLDEDKVLSTWALELVWLAEGARF
ncbi:MAG TPA: hypothetical protein VK043_05570 [Burkholderiales bacterium]|nr:hypothetical protein [Burkholderiales bacterium]